MPHLRIREIMDELAATGKLGPTEFVLLSELIATCLAASNKGPMSGAERAKRFRARRNESNESNETVTLKEEGSHTLQEKNIINNIIRAKEKPLKKGSRLPEGWQPSLETLSYADKLGCSAAEISAWAEDFRLWAYSASGQVSIKRDWEAAFKGWMRREKAKGRQEGFKPKPRYGQVVQGSFRKELPPEPPRKPRTTEEQAEIDAKLSKLIKVKRL
jgi:hypothetical protein